jgi:hypothetical protein
MFVKPCVLGMVLNSTNNTSENRINKALWAGAMYNHIDTKNGVRRMRQDMYEEIKDCMDTSYFPAVTLSLFQVVVVIGLGRHVYDSIGLTNRILSKAASI